MSKQNCKPNQGRSSSKPNRSSNDRNNSNFSKNKGTNTRKGKDAYSNSEEDFKKGMTANDPSWYAEDASLLRDAASIPFSWATGTPFDLENPGATNERRIAVPGICTIHLMPSYGYADSPNDPMNIAGTNLYSYDRQANSGATNYNAPDFLIYNFALAQAHSFVNFAQRLYGIATLYSERNRYMPRALVECQGVDFDDLQAHLANFRYGINVYINKLASLAAPATMSIYKRQAYLYRDIYTEGTSLKDQLYMYVPIGFLKFTLQNKSGAYMGALELSRFGPYPSGNRWTVDQILQYASNLIDPILSSEDFNIMSGDIRKAWGEGSLAALVSLPEYYPIVPVFDIATLEQMKNAICVGDIDSSEPLIQQSDNGAYLVSKPTVLYQWDDDNVQPSMYYNILQQQVNNFKQNKLLTTTTKDTTPELIMESTRLMPAFVSAGSVSGPGSQSSVEINVSCGSELATYFKIWYYDYPISGGSQLVSNTYQSYDMRMVIEESSTSNPLHYGVGAIQALEKVSHFKFHPFYQVFPIYNQDGNSFTRGCIMSDIDNYAILTDQVLQRLHEVALLSLLKVPNPGNR